MPTYKIPVVYSMWGLLPVKADSFEEAVKYANSPDSPLPPDADYIDDSAMVDDSCDMMEYFNEDVVTERDKEFIKKNFPKME